MVGSEKMSGSLNRRSFLKAALAGAASTAVSLSPEESVLLARGGKDPPPPPAGPPVREFPQGKIGTVKISRLICGGNLINGYAHSRDLIYVSDLLKNYFTDEKIIETWELCEENGINTAIANVRGGRGDARRENSVRMFQKYWNERGGRLQWIAQTNPLPNDLTSSIRKAADAGAVGAFVQGGIADRFVKQGKIDLLARAVECIRENGMVAGVGGHSLQGAIACEREKIPVDFYFKTLNPAHYRCDSPDETVQFFKKVEKPWIAYKVLGAGIIHPLKGFRHAFQHGADFICAGMFDFQVLEDVLVARRILAEKLDRARPWRG